MLYPPSDICSVNIPPELGGCGVAHVRPAGPDGEPVHPWALSCTAGKCEEHLAATDARFVRTVADIPLTYDQAKEHEQLAVRGSATRDDILMRALAKIAGIDVPASVGRPLPAGAPVSALVACPGCGNGQGAGQAFCGQCGAPMRGTVPAAAIAGKAS